MAGLLSASDLRYFESRREMVLKFRIEDGRVGEGTSNGSDKHGRKVMEEERREVEEGDGGRAMSTSNGDDGGPQGMRTAASRALAESFSGYFSGLS